MALQMRMSLGEAAREIGRIAIEFAVPIFVAIWGSALALGLFTLLRNHEDAWIERLVDFEGEHLVGAATRAVESRMLEVLELARRWEGVDHPDAAQWVRDAQTIADRDPVYRAVEWRGAAFEPVWSTPLTALRAGSDLDTTFETSRVVVISGMADRAAGSVSGSFIGPGGRRLIVFAAPMLRRGSRVGLIDAIVRSRDLIDTFVRPQVQLGWSIAVLEGPYHVYGPLASAEGAEAERWRRSTEVTVGGLTWSFDYWPGSELLEKLRSYGPPLVLLLGVFTAMVVAALARSLELALRKRRTALPPA